MKTRFLPYTAKRVSIGDDCKVYISGKEITPKGNKVKLSWVLGFIEYDIRLLHYVAWCGSKLDDYLTQHMQMVNGDEYYFNELECEDVKDHYYVPGYSKYVIARNGDLYSLISGQHMAWGTTKDGYRYCRAVTDNGESRVLFRHRALGLTFKHPKVSVAGLVINHINGIPGDEDLLNIEWATYSENNQHAYDNYLKESSAVSVECLNLKTGETTKYPSITACSVATGVGREAIRWRLAKGDFEVYSDMLLFKKSDDKPFPSVENVKVNRLGRGCDIVARNVFTKEQVIFTGASSGELLTGVNADTILLHARTKADLPIHGYNFRYMDEIATFKDHSPRSLEIFKAAPKKPGFGIVLTSNEEEKFFPSVSCAIDELGITKSHILKLAKANGERNGFVYSLHDPRVQ